MVSVHAYSVFVRSNGADGFFLLCKSFFENDARAAHWALSFQARCADVALWRGWVLVFSTCPKSAVLRDRCGRRVEGKLLAIM